MTTFDVTVAEKFVCPGCGRCYKYKRGLMEHQRYECGKEPQFLCPHCPHRTNRRTSLKTHIAIKHNLLAS